MRIISVSSPNDRQTCTIQSQSISLGEEVGRKVNLHDAEIYPNTNHQALTDLACKLNEYISQLNRRVIGGYGSPKVLATANTLTVPRAEECWQPSTHPPYDSA